MNYQRRDEGIAPYNSGAGNNPPPQPYRDMDSGLDLRANTHGDKPRAQAQSRLLTEPALLYGKEKMKKLYYPTVAPDKAARVFSRVSMVSTVMVVSARLFFLARVEAVLPGPNSMQVSIPAADIAAI